MPYLIVIVALALVALGVLIGSELRRRRPPRIDRSPPMPERGPSAVDLMLRDAYERRSQRLERMERRARDLDRGRAVAEAVAGVGLLVVGVLVVDWVLEALRLGVLS